MKRQLSSLIILLVALLCGTGVSCGSTATNSTNASANIVAEEPTSLLTITLATSTIEIQVTETVPTPTETITSETSTLIPSPSPTLTPTPGFDSIFTQVSIAETGWQNFINLKSEHINGVLSPDHSLFAWAEIEKTYVVNVTTGEQIWLLEKPPAPRNGTKVLLFSPDGTLLANGGAEETVYVWNLQTGELVYELSLERPVEFLQFHAHMNLLVTGGGRTGDIDGSKIIVSDLDSSVHIQYPEETWLGSITLSSTAQLLAINSSGVVKLWDIPSGEIRQLPFDTDGERSFENLVAFFPDGKQLIAQVDDRLRIWNLESDEEIEVEDASSLTVDLFPFQLEFLPNGYFLVWDGTTSITLWNYSGKVVGMLESEVSISNIEMTPDGLYLITFTADEQVQAWKLPSP